MIREMIIHSSLVTWASGGNLPSQLPASGSRLKWKSTYFLAAAAAKTKGLVL